MARRSHCVHLVLRQRLARLVQGLLFPCRGKFHSPAHLFSSVLSAQVHNECKIRQLIMTYRSSLVARGRKASCALKSKNVQV